ncbi:MAG: serine hydrolase [Desulfomonilaceae bacterium]
MPVTARIAPSNRIILYAILGLLLLAWATAPSLVEARASHSCLKHKKAAKGKIVKGKATKAKTARTRAARTKVAKTKAAKTRAVKGKAAKSKVVKSKVVKSKVVKSKITKSKVANHKVAKKKKAKPEAQGVQAKAVYCVNLRSNQTLLARNADLQLPIASLSKLVTALVALDQFPLDRKVTVPDNIKTVPKSVVGLKAGDSVSVLDLLHGLLIGSGNDCAETLACAIPGGRKSFIAAMNEKVRSMGARHTFFYTPSGLDRKISITKEGKKTTDVDSNVSTAREIATIASTAFSNPIIRSICQKKRHVMASAINPKGYIVKSTNKLLRDHLPLIGGKTGYTARAGHCLATEFTPGRNILLIVVLGSPNHFRDTRLVYHKALKETNRMRIVPTAVRPRLAAWGRYPDRL